MARPVGSRNRRTIEQATAVKVLTDAGLPLKAIARQVGSHPQTIKRIKADIDAYLAAEATSVAEDWRKTITAAVDKGNHKPAQDWLLQAKVIEPVGQDKAQGPQILIGIASLPGLPTVTTFAPSDCTTNGALEAKPTKLLNE